MPWVAFVAGAAMYLAMLVKWNSSEYALAWWLGFGVWTTWSLAAAWQWRKPKEWFRAWLLAFLIVPKRDPDPDYICALNFQSNGITIPVVEMILGVMALAALLAAIRSNPVRANGSFQKLCHWVGIGLISCAAIGVFMNIHNFNSMPEFYPMTFYSRAWGRILRSFAEGAIIVAMAKLEWNNALINKIGLVIDVSLLLAVAEFALWAAHVLPSGLQHYLNDFRGGFRSVMHGYGAGLMMTQVWILFLAFCCLRKRWYWLLAAVGISFCAGFLSYQRTVALAIGFGGLLFIAIRFPPRIVFGSAFVAIALVLGPARDTLSHLFEDASARKGGEYWSFNSLGPRLDLAKLSWAAFRRSPVFGVGQGALTSVVTQGTVTGWLPPTNFVKKELLGEFSLSLSGDRQFDSHNLWISFVTESGIAGLVVVAGMWVLIGKSIALIRFRARSDYVAAISCIAFVLSYSSQAEPYILSLLCLIILTCVNCTSRIKGATSAASARVDEELLEL
jgi:hypothetical protein